MEIESKLSDVGVTFFTVMSQLSHETGAINLSQNFSDLDFSRNTDELATAFARRLTGEYGTVAIPPSVFYHDKQDNKVLRFCFAKRDDTLNKAAKRLCRI